MNSRVLDETAQRAFESDAKIGILATVDGEGLPHATLITTLQAKGPTELMFGQFSEGRSKLNLRRNQRAAFLVMTRDRRLWRGHASWKTETKQGEDYELYNQKPMFRYNAYFGIHTIHYLDLVDVLPVEGVPVAGMALGAALTALAASGQRTDQRDPVLTPWAERHLAKASTLKFLVHLGDEGYPNIVPLVPCRAEESRRLLLAPTVHRSELEALRPDDAVAVFALNLEMESVLLRGRFRGYRRRRGARTGVIDLDWVYNSMPPKQGVIYPPEPLRSVHQAQ
ncbi:MAG: pyridoxamine 5'-phosphate oxidase family protein [Candidatus Binatia bacterium]